VAASSNRTQVTSVEEVTLGTTPNTPRMRARRFTGETLAYKPTFSDSEEMRPDGTSSDPILTGTDNTGPINFEFHYPLPNSPLDSDIKSSMRATWTQTPERDNDGTADSVITDIGTTTDTVACTTGAAFVASQLVRFSGNSNSANNGTFKCTTGSATAPVFASSGFVAETAPPAASRMKVVGFAGASGDITATSTGLGSSSLDFTTLGLIVGMSIKIGGSSTSNKFATAALNVTVRITAIAAHAITLDNRPSGWTTDAGTGKLIWVFFGDHITNGTTRLSQTIERAFLGQGTPTYFVHTGMVASKYYQTFQAQKPLTGNVTYLGMTGSQSTSTLDASPDATLSLASFPVFAASANVGRVTENGSSIAGPNFCQTFEFTIDWSPTASLDITALGPQDITQHEMMVTGKFEVEFGDNSLLTRFFAGTASSVLIYVNKSNRGFVWQFPRITYNGDGSPNATGRNQNVKLPLSWKASRDDALTNAQVIMDRFEYVE